MKQQFYSADTKEKNAFK